MGSSRPAVRTARCRTASYYQRSNGRRVTLRCPSAMKSGVEKTAYGGSKHHGEKYKKAQWIGFDVEGFRCEQREGEKDSTFKKRRLVEAEEFAANNGVCAFKVASLAFHFRPSVPVFTHSGEKGRRSPHLGLGSSFGIGLGLGSSSGKNPPG